MPWAAHSRHEQIEYLPPDRRVKRGGRLIGHDQLRVRGKGHGDRDPLGHAARELVRIAAGDAPMIPQSDIGKQARDIRAGRSSLHHRGDLVRDAHRRIEGTDGVLKDVAERVNPEPAQRSALEFANGLTGDHELAGRPFGVGRQEATQRERERALAGAALADQADLLALAHGERGAVERTHPPLPRGKVDHQVP